MDFEFVEGLRCEALKRLRAMRAFGDCWPTWAAEIGRLTDDLSSANGIYEVGSNLSQIFKLTADKGRSQGSLSGGGAAWEGLVCWYLNLVLTNTRAVVIKQSKTLIPSPLSDAIAVNYNNHQTNTESDIVGIVFPEDQNLQNSQYDRSLCEQYADDNLERMSLHVIQCKTNWNDNAQIPMLWDMVYRAKGFRDSGVSVGKNGRSIGDLQGFSYSFVTVPSQKSSFSSGQMAVKRVSGLSGRNFWGMPTQSGVAWSVSEMFKHVFGDEVIGDVRRHILDLIHSGSIKNRLEA